MDDKFFIRQYSFGDFSHGGIGYADAENILREKGFKAIAFPYYDSFTAKAKFYRFVYLIRTFFTIRENATIVFIFPVFAQMTKMLLKLLLLKKSTRLICFVADIDGIKDGDKKMLEKEIAELAGYKYFIVHNASMQEWLQHHVSPEKTAAIGFFDFPAGIFEGKREKSKQIVFAGNLAKSGFLEHLLLLYKEFPALQFNLYGPGCTENMKLQKNVHFKGILQPYTLPAQLEGSFGLVWDGDSTGVPAGPLGDYMKFISHHKLSLYILAGLPVIVPAIAASATLVKKYGIGIIVNTLHEIDHAIEQLSAEDYARMQINMKPLARNISGGNNLSAAIDALTG